MKVALVASSNVPSFSSFPGVPYSIEVAVELEDLR